MKVANQFIAVGPEAEHQMYASSDLRDVAEIADDEGATLEQLASRECLPPTLSFQ
jgi:hypothetical protein